MSDDKMTEQAEALAKHLKQTGFDTEIKKAKTKPSIVIDLTTSKLIF